MDPSAEGSDDGTGGGRVAGLGVSPDVGGGGAAWEGRG